MADDLDGPSRQSRRVARKCAHISKILMREELKAQVKKVTEILKKCVANRTEEEKDLLKQSPEIVKNIEKRCRLRQLSEKRKLEVEDSTDAVEEKCRELAVMLVNAKHAVFYTGAGISTAASIPDYRGPAGVWTLMEQGIQPKLHDLSEAEPTYTHMCISALESADMVKHVVSQNCDGLHLRSGLPPSRLSELHGNMFIEVCHQCGRQYVRLFDVTENTGVRRHRTGRQCSHCNLELHDTIVHFGEKSRGFGAPYNWEEAAHAADKADLIVCIGSSLKVLKKYPCLWSMHKPVNQRPKLVIVNLQWTPKDDVSNLKINAKCDVVMAHLVELLGVEPDTYSLEKDPIFSLSFPLSPDELLTINKKILCLPGSSQSECNDRKPFTTSSGSKPRAALQLPSTSSVSSTVKPDPISPSEIPQIPKPCFSEPDRKLFAQDHLSSIMNCDHTKLMSPRTVAQRPSLSLLPEPRPIPSVLSPISTRKSSLNHQTSPKTSENDLKRPAPLNLCLGNNSAKLSRLDSSSSCEPLKAATKQHGSMKVFGNTGQISQRSAYSDWKPYHTGGIKTEGHCLKKHDGSSELKTQYSNNLSVNMASSEHDQSVQYSDVIAQTNNLPTANMLKASQSSDSAVSTDVSHVVQMPDRSGHSQGVSVSKDVPADYPPISVVSAIDKTAVRSSVSASHDGEALVGQEERIVEMARFHQTLHMLQLQSQIHMHQQALTSHLPTDEQERLKQQQDLMRNTLNALLTQQLLKLEQMPEVSENKQLSDQSQGTVPVSQSHSPKSHPSSSELNSPRARVASDHLSPSSSSHEQVHAGESSPQRASQYSEKPDLEAKPNSCKDAHCSRMNPGSSLSVIYPAIVNALHGTYNYDLPPQTCHSLTVKSVADRSAEAGSSAHLSNCSKPISSQEYEAFSSNQVELSSSRSVEIGRTSAKMGQNLSGKAIPNAGDTDNDRVKASRTTPQTLLSPNQYYHGETKHVRLEGTTHAGAYPHSLVSVSGTSPTCPSVQDVTCETVHCADQSMMDRDTVFTATAADEDDEDKWSSAPGWFGKGWKPKKYRKKFKR